MRALLAAVVVLLVFAGALGLGQATEPDPADAVNNAAAVRAVRKLDRNVTGLRRDLRNSLGVTPSVSLDGRSIRELLRQICANTSSGNVSENCGF